MIQIYNLAFPLVYWRVVI